MFYCLSEVGEGFLVPAVEFIAEKLKLPPAIAGVTLLSFAGGAPDLFTQLAAVSAGQGHVDLGLAISSTMGSGLFTTCVLTASVLLIRPLEVEDRGAFVRDASAYLVACLAILGFLWNNQLGWSESLILVLMYIAYVALALWTSRGVQPTVATTHQQQGAGTVPHLRLHTSMEAEEQGIELACLAPVGQPQPEGASLGGSCGTLVLTAPTKAALGAAQTQTFRKASSSGGSGGGWRYTAVRTSPQANGNAPKGSAAGSPRDLIESPFSGVPEPSEVSGEPTSSATPYSERAAEAQPLFRRSPAPETSRGSALLAVAKAIWGPLRGKSWVAVVRAVVAAPVHFILHSTNPSLHIDTYSAGYGARLAAIVPALRFWP
eukprot:jgi/Botrbrau1/2135/Bobra.0093s0042.1